MFSQSTHWSRLGLVLSRPQSGSHNDVAGDPSIVWDAKINNWRTVLFYSPPGHGQAVCVGQHPVTGLPDRWRFDGRCNLPILRRWVPAEIRISPISSPMLIGRISRPKLMENIGCSACRACVRAAATAGWAKHHLLQQRQLRARTIVRQLGH